MAGNQHLILKPARQCFARVHSVTKQMSERSESEYSNWETARIVVRLLVMAGRIYFISQPIRVGYVRDTKGALIVAFR